MDRLTRTIDLAVATHSNGVSAKWAESYDELTEKIKGIFGNLSGKKMIYIAGDSRICVALHEYFKKELRNGNKQIRVKPFWNSEKKD